MLKKISAATDQQWFAKFCAKDFLLDDAPWSDRPVEVDSDQFKTLMENNQISYHTRDSQILKISKSITGENEKYVFHFTEKN